jgi:hypothetical protein
MKTFICLALAAALTGCASYDGRGLAPGSSTAQVEAVMGKSAERLTTAGGETVLFFPRGPEGRDTFAARFTPQGTLIGIEQRLTAQNFSRVLPGKSTAKEVRELLGPPSHVYQYPRMPREVWDYPVLVDFRWFNFFVQYSPDGVVRETYLLHDPSYDAGAKSG